MKPTDLVLAQDTCPELAPLSAALQKKLGETLGLQRWIDLALHLPVRHQSEGTESPLNELSDRTPVIITGTITESQSQQRPRPQWKLTVEDGAGRISLRFLHFYPSQLQRFSVGQAVKASGTVRLTRFGWEIVHPKLELFDGIPETPTEAQTGALKPVYPSGAGIRQTDWPRWIQQLPADCFLDLLPPALVQSQPALAALPGWGEALMSLHRELPPEWLEASNQRRSPAWQRIKLEELLAQQLALAQVRQTRTQWQAQALPKQANAAVQRLLDNLPFKPTAAQQRAFEDILKDLSRTQPMQRLLQGDVGSGKTLVAALACTHAVANGFQAAMMAPTEILSEQHFNKLAPLLQSTGLKCLRLIGAMSKKAKQAVVDEIATGEPCLVIGTHALVQSTVRFGRLALVVVDEQHRFGVQQRLSLLEHNAHGRVPHQLMMSATPIPRTLAQTYLSDLDVSVLDEKPPGRQKILTKLIAQSKKETLIMGLQQEVAAQRQVYWVCPLIEESESLQLQAAEQSFQALCEALPDVRIALLHGKQSAKEKAATMAAFTARELDILVSTTVIEVGVDVPNASLMVIEHAERFGLSQLHQLRGRVGRGSLQSVCVLLYGAPLSWTGKRRLKAMHESDDGFYLAEVDLELRGPGEVLGKRQSGAPGLRYANPLTDHALVQIARQLAAQVNLKRDVWAHRLVRRWLGEKAWWLT